MKPIARWTIGNTNKSGYESLVLSIESFLKHYDLEVIICHNCPKTNLPSELFNFKLLDQSLEKSYKVIPIGVAWKFYPCRIDINRHELCIDNDLIINEKLEEIDNFFSFDSTLLLEGDSRAYGRFDNHVPKKFMINSGLYGVPPKFDLQSYVNFYSGESWEKNAINRYDKNETFDEQGLVAHALLNYHKYFIISNKTITNCENYLLNGKGHHFIGLNRRNYHFPFRLWKSKTKKFYF
jgi:hypothetical protein